MAETTVTMPRVSETIDEFYVVEWLVDVGAPVAAEQVLLRVETDKAVVEVPSPAAGTLTAQLVAVDAEVRTGEAIATLES